MAKALSKTKVKTSTKKVAGVAGKVLTATAGLNAQIASQKKLLQSAKTEKRAAERVETTWMNRLKTAISRRPDIAKYTEEQFAKWKIPEQYEKTLTLLEENESLRKDLVAMEEQEALALQSSEQRLAPTTFIRGEQALVERQYEIKKNALAGRIAANAATAEAYQGNIELARGLVQDMVQATTYDYERRVQDITTFIELNQNIIERAGEDVKYAMSNLLQNAQSELGNAREEKRVLGELMVQYPGAGIKPTMTLDQAYSAAKREAARKEAEEERRWQAELAASQASSGGSGGKADEYTAIMKDANGSYAIDTRTGKIIWDNRKKSGSGSKSSSSSSGSSWLSSTIGKIKQGAGIVRDIASGKISAKEFRSWYRK